MFNWLKRSLGMFVESDLSLEEMKEMVEIPGKKYSIGKYQVTQVVWQSVMDYNPSKFKGSSRPVDSVNWLDCVLFCNKLSEKEGLDKVYTLPDEVEQALKNQSSYKDDKVDKLSTEVSQNLEANGYRLPTEWEWWFAAKANDDFYSPWEINDLDEVAWYCENNNKQTHGVGQKKANGFGLYDMSGNVLEWCWDPRPDKDIHTEDYIPTEDSTGPSTGSIRMIRGGLYGSGASAGFFSDRRGYRLPGGLYLGFRLARTIR